MSTNPQFKNLLQPGRIGSLELKNRIVMPPMEMNYATEEGFVTDRTINHYEKRARGGVGLIIVEATHVHLCGRCRAHQLSISDDAHIAGMSKLVEAVHKHGTKVALQLQHGGRAAKSKLTGMQAVAPSPIPETGGDVPKELTVEEIAEIVGHFRQAALRARKAGFDAVEIHGAHGYILSQFLSPAVNKRRDEYGGSLENRARFLCETVTSIRQAVGQDYPVWCRINGMEIGLEDGFTLHDAQLAAKLAEKAGADGFHVSAYGAPRPGMTGVSPLIPGAFIELAEGVKKAVTVPVIAVGNITPEIGEKTIEDGKADFIAIGKGLIADPDLPNKLAEGRLEDINPCIVCTGCTNDLRTGRELGARCQTNAVVGRAEELIPTPAPRKVLVIGGGPAGMEAARVAALRGHNVSLWEKEDRLGGQLIKAAIGTYKDRIALFTAYMENQIKKLRVKCELRKEGTAALIQELNPDVLVLATGATSIIPDIPGATGSNVVTAFAVLEGKAEAGEKVVVIGGGMVGCETAEFLAEKGKSVTILEMLPEIGADMYESLKPTLYDLLVKKGVRTEVNAKVMEISQDGVKASRNGTSEHFAADTVVLAMGTLPENSLAQALQGKVKEIHTIGDCVKPRRIGEAIFEGFCAGRDI